MDKIQNILLIILILLLGLGIGIFIVPRLVKTKTFLSISTSHPASVYVDGKYVGKAPLLVPTAKSELTLKLTPDDQLLTSFDQKVTVGKNTTTKVSAVFSADASLSSSVVSYYEKIGATAVEMSVVSIPNLARLKIDGQVRGFTPVKLETTLGKHNIELSFEGYFPYQFEIETKEGYRVISIVKLAKDASFVHPPIEIPKDPTEIQEEEESKPQVEILDTPTGFLRVREEPNSGSVEVGQISPGEKYELIQRDEASGWFEIRMDEDKTGWVSSQYAKLVELP